MSMKTSADLYTKLAAELIPDETSPEQDAMEELRSIFTSKKKSGHFTYVVTVDEIDHLLNLDSDVLYTLFEWSLHQCSRLVVIGIANALDLTDRFLPRLKARNLKPQLLPFLPYTAAQIASIITAKLRSLIPDDLIGKPEFIPFVHPTAIELCSRKVASQTGDLRKAFDIIRRTIDLVGTETKIKRQIDATSQSLQKSPSKSPLAENPNLASITRIGLMPAEFLVDLTPLTAPRATTAHVSRVSTAALSGGIFQRLQTLNLQQKAALCALLSFQKTSRKALTSKVPCTRKLSSAAPTIKRLHETYCKLCRSENALDPLTATEFADVISGLETLGLVGDEDGGRAFTKRNTPRKENRREERQLVSFVEAREVQACFHGTSGAILKGLLLDGEHQ